MRNYITFCSDRRFINQLIAFCESLLQNDNEAILFINYYSFSNWEMSRLSYAFPFIRFIKKTQNSENYHEINSKRLRDYVSTIELLDYNDSFVLIDSDTIVNNALCVSDYIGDCDAGFTLKYNGFPLNFGVIYGRNTIRFREMMLGMSSEIDQVFQSNNLLKKRVSFFGAADQSTLGSFLFGLRKPIEILYDERKLLVNKKLIFNGANIIILECSEYNETECIENFRDPKVLHFKAGWHSTLKSLKLDHIGKYRQNATCSTQFLYWLNFYNSGLKRLTEFDYNVLINQSPSDIIFSKRLSGGMMFSELMILENVINLINPDFLVESGRHNGVSTEFLLKRFKNKILYSIDFRRDKLARNTESRLKEYENLTFWYGNSLHSLPNKLKQIRGSSIVIIDGPKGINALKLVKDLFKNSNVLLAAVHDSYLGSEFRKELDLCPELKYFSTDDLKFQQFDVVDKGIDKIGFESKSYSFERLENTERSYGPTLTFIYNTSSYSGRKRVVVLNNFRARLFEIFHYIFEIIIKCYIFRY